MPYVFTLVCNKTLEVRSSIFNTEEEAKSFWNKQIRNFQMFYGNLTPNVEHFKEENECIKGSKFDILNESYYMILTKVEVK